MSNRLFGLLLLVATETAEYYLGRILLETAQQYRTRRGYGELEMWLRQQHGDHDGRDASLTR